MGVVKRQLTDLSIRDETDVSPSKRQRLSTDPVDVQSTTLTLSFGKAHVCPFENCDKAFDRKSKLEIHIRCHTNERPYACKEPGCDKDFQRNEHLTRHMKDRHGIGDVQEFLCTYIITNVNGQEVECGKILSTASKLRRHVAMHKDKEPLKCIKSGCGKTFRKQETLDRHVRQAHLGVNAFRCSQLVKRSGLDSCECGETFATVGLLKGHQSRAHSSLKFFCELCQTDDSFNQSNADALDNFTSTSHTPLGFKTYSDFQTHMKLVHPPSCPECGMQCESTRALRAHQDIVHATAPERQNFKCTWPGCDRGFNRAGNLNVHVQTVHVKTKEFKCGIFDLSTSAKVIGWDGKGCGRALTSKASLEEHIRTQHMGFPSKLKKYIKAESTDSASTLMDIDEAMTPIATRTGDRALAMLTGHGYEDSRPIACLVDQCQLRFLREYDLAQHVELTHGWHMDDVNDAIAERKALFGDQFWIGGGEEVISRLDRYPMAASTLAEESSFRLKLQLALQANMMAGFEKTIGLQDDTEDDLAIDPALHTV